MYTFVNKIAFLASVIMVAAPSITWCETVEPHCTDGDCSDYVLWCQQSGRDVLCLDHGTEHEVTVCLGQRALTGIWNNHPNACYGTCAGATLCNDGTTTQIAEILNVEPLGMCPDESPTLIDIAAMIESESPRYAGFAHGLLQHDVNGDGYACASYKCTVCPPNAQHCVLICNYIAPLSDNDQ